MLQNHLNSRDNNLWLIRLIAAIMVIYGHCYPLAAHLQKNSHIIDPIIAPWLNYVGFQKGLSGLAVCIFFFISGLLIAKSAATQPWHKFWAARILRIYPALWANLIFCVLLGYYVSGLDWLSFFLNPEVLHFLWYNGTLTNAYFTLPNVFADLPWNGINGSLWTLPEELRMYIYCFIIGALGMLRKNSLSKIAFNIMCLGAFACFLTLGELPHINKAAIVYLPLYFLLGMAAYVNAAHIRLKWWVLAALMAALIPTYIYASRGCYDLAFAVALSYFILLLAYGKHWRKLDFGHIGDFSYGTYLYGYPIQQLIIWLHGFWLKSLL
jgi:peptidoglycan/LPS O-acetylase OafA/YrhL